MKKSKKGKSTGKAKKFHLGDILSITAGPLVSPQGMDGIYDILNFMTGDKLFAHQLPRASGECRPYLLEQHPQLKKVDASGVNKKNWKKWLAKQIKKYGEELIVKPISKEAHEVKNPIQELEEKLGPDKVVPVVVE